MSLLFQFRTSVMCSIINLVVLILYPSCFGIEYGPSIVSLLPKQNGVRSSKTNLPSASYSSIANEEDQDYTSSDNHVRLLLKDYPNFAVVLPIVEGHSWATAMEIWRLTFPSFGEKYFSVEAPENHGIVAVIQELDIKARQKFSCNLYIKFGDSLATTERICGKVEKGDSSFQPKSLLGPRMFSSPNGKMTLYFNAFPGLLGLDSHIRVAIAFTAYKEGCYFNDTDPEDTSINPHDYKPCALRGWQSSCIKSKLFCDNVINCGEKDEFERDEAKCFKNINVEQLLPVDTFGTSQTEQPSPPIMSEETRYLLYSHFTSAVIGILGFCTLFIVTKYMLTRICCDGTVKAHSELEAQHSVVNSSSESRIGSRIDLEDRDNHLNVSAEMGHINSSRFESNVEEVNGRRVGCKTQSRLMQDNPPSYFELFPNVSVHSQRS